MLLERIYDEDLAQASYLIGCQLLGEAVVVDPRRDINVYLDLAAKNDMRITAVTETHIHADYLSGTLELAAATGARVFVSDEGGPDWTYGPAFDSATRMRDGDTITVGNLILEAVHTPGHTPEHLSFLLTDGAQATAPGFMLTGDFVFVGDLGRPDLLDEAAGGVDTRFQGAKDLFSSLQNRLLTLPDYIQILPGHGSGSACGKALGAVPTSTIGYERAFSWWSQFVIEDDESGFIETLLAGQPDAPSYFGRMKVHNRRGPEVRGPLPDLSRYSGEDMAAALDRDEIIVIDSRPHDEVHLGTVAGSVNIPGLEKSASFGAWVIDPDTEHRSLVVLAANESDAEQFRRHLMRVGIDRVVGYTLSLDGLELTTPRLVSPGDLNDFEHAVLLDVRNASEYAEGHLPGAVHITAGQVLGSTDHLPDEGTIVTYCRSGARNSVAASALRRRGYDIAELEGSYLGWSQLPGNNPVTA